MSDQETISEIASLLNRLAALEARVAALEAQIERAKRATLLRSSSAGVGR